RIGDQVCADGRPVDAVERAVDPDAHPATIAAAPGAPPPTRDPGARRTPVAAARPRRRTPARPARRSPRRGRLPTSPRPDRARVQPQAARTAPRSAAGRRGPGGDPARGPADAES